MTPTAPINVDGLNVDLTSNQAIPINMSVSDLNISVAGVGGFALKLSFAGTINDVSFVGNAPSTTSGALYDIPGDYLAQVQGNVTAKLYLLGAQVADLGSIYSLNETVTVPGSLPGLVTTADGSGGAGPYPADLLASFVAALNDIVVPIDADLALSYSKSLGNSASGLRSFSVNPGSTLHADLTLGDLSYNLNGTVPNVVVPEPQSFALALCAMIGALVCGMYRRGR